MAIFASPADLPKGVGCEKKMRYEFFIKRRILRPGKAFTNQLFADGRTDRY